MKFGEAPISHEQSGEASKKDIFQKALEDELIEMENSGRISSKQAEEKRKAASFIEGGFSEDPKNDALIFSKAGIADEKEMIELFKGAALNEKDVDGS